MISVTIIVKNGEKRIEQVLERLRPFDEVILYDTGSTDRTLEIGKSFSNVKAFEKELIGFGHAHNEAASLATHPWILSIDADEVPSQELVDEILVKQLDKETVYDLPFHNYYNGKLIKWCGWYPESHIRLYNKKITAFSVAMVHEGVISEGLEIEKLAHPVNHYSYDSISDFLTKMERYSSLFAKQYKGKKRSSPLIALWHGIGGFWKSFFLKKGFMGGFEGFLISVYIGHTAFYKYLKLYQENRCSSP